MRWDQNTFALPVQCFDQIPSKYYRKQSHCSRLSMLLNRILPDDEGLQKPLLTAFLPLHSSICICYSVLREFVCQARLMKCNCTSGCCSISTPWDYDLQFLVRSYHKVTVTCYKRLNRKDRKPTTTKYAIKWHYNNLTLKKEPTFWVHRGSKTLVTQILCAVSTICH